jgi:signal transduction histidine kinase
VVEAARELTSAEYAALGVLDRDRTELERFIYLGIDDETKRAIGNLPRGRGVLGELIREPAPLRLRDVNEHPHAYGFPPGHPPMHSFLGVPISIRGETYGNLYMTQKQDADEFTDEDEEAAKILAGWAGIAIENARLYTALSEREAVVERSLKRAEASVEIARALGGETDVDRVLDLIVKRARALVEARMLLVLLRRGGRLVVVAEAGEIGEEVENLTIPTDDAVFRAAMQERVAQHLKPGSPPSEARLRERLGAEAALVVPLLFRGHAVGALVALDREAAGVEFAEEDLRLLQAFATSAATAVATAQTVESQRLQQQVETAERERRRWAQELHDDALQGLAAIRISLATALQSGEEDRGRGIEKAARETVDRLEEQINELSRLIDDLRPASLERLGLGPALEALAEEYSARGDLGIDVEVEIPEKLSGEEDRVIYRLVQEALNNVVKHAAAGSANVSARLVDHQVQIAVQDDGRGFDPSAIPAGRGLIWMRERIELLGGEIDVESEPDTGTRVSAKVPVQLS